jgi:hypothetical protein
MALFDELFHGFGGAHFGHDFIAEHAHLALIAGEARNDLDIEMQRIGENPRVVIGGRPDARGGKLDRRFGLDDVVDVLKRRGLKSRARVVGAFPIQLNLLRSNNTP